MHDELFKTNFKHISICNGVGIPSKVIPSSSFFPRWAQRGKVQAIHLVSPLSFSNQPGSHFMHLCLTRPAFSEPRVIPPCLAPHFFSI